MSTYCEAHGVNLVQNGGRCALCERGIPALAEAASAPPPGDAHIANEWADMASNGIQWLRNVQDGTSTCAEALAEMESNAKRIRALRSALTKRNAPLADADGPGEEDGPWAEGWEQRAALGELAGHPGPLLDSPQSPQAEHTAKKDDKVP